MDVKQNAGPGVASQSRLDLIRERHKVLRDKIQATQREISQELEAEAKGTGTGSARTGPAFVVLPPAQPPISPPASPAAGHGLTAKQVGGVPLMQSIWKDHYERGLSYEKIEQDPAYNLRRARGMTAYRLCRKYEAASGTKRPDARESTP